MQAYCPVTQQWSHWMCLALLKKRSNTYVQHTTTNPTNQQSCQQNWVGCFPILSCKRDSCFRKASSQSGGLCELTSSHKWYISLIRPSWLDSQLILPTKTLWSLWLNWIFFSIFFHIFQTKPVSKDLLSNPRDPTAVRPAWPPEAEATALSRLEIHGNIWKHTWKHWLLYHVVSCCSHFLVQKNCNLCSGWVSDLATIRTWYDRRFLRMSVFLPGEFWGKNILETCSQPETQYRFRFLTSCIVSYCLMLPEDLQNGWNESWRILRPTEKTLGSQLVGNMCYCLPTQHVPSSSSFEGMISLTQNETSSIEWLHGGYRHLVAKVAVVLPAKRTGGLRIHSKDSKNQSTKYDKFIQIPRGNWEQCRCSCIARAKGIWGRCALQEMCRAKSWPWIAWLPSIEVTLHQCMK